MAVEVEARFSATGPEPLTRLATAASLGNADLGLPATFDEIDRYLDTEAGDLAAARWACRLRSRGSSVIISLKGPPANGTGGWLHRRPEVEGPATASTDPTTWPPSQARDMLRELRGEAPLRERFRLHQRRTERTVNLAGRTIGTLSLDQVRVERDDRRAGEFHVVELELLDDASADHLALDHLAMVLAAIPGLSPEPSTKLERALKLLVARTS